jgi:hypothetical protein
MSSREIKEIEYCEKFVKNSAGSGDLNVFQGFERDVCEGAVRSGDLEAFNNDYGKWITWLKWASVALDENDYLMATIYGLSLSPGLVATDYGTAKRRDLGQLWTDSIRGFLGEIAVAKWFRERHGINVELDYGLEYDNQEYIKHQKKKYLPYLPTDIKRVNGKEPGICVSIKTTKLDGIWLDIPGAQITHSDVFILVRLGITREHFVAFLKKISAIRDKLMQKAVEGNLISRDEIEKIWERIPEFKAIPAYIAGFFDKRELKLDEKIIDANGYIEGKKRKRIVINKFLGYWDPRDNEYEKKLIELLKRKLEGRINIKENLNIEFEGIGNFSAALHFIVNSGLLKKNKGDWNQLIKELTEPQQQGTCKERISNLMRQSM